MILADKIIYLRKKNGWSQEELAEKMHVSRQAVSKWESAQSLPDLEKILMLSRLFGVTTDYLLKDEIEDEEFSRAPEQTLQPSAKRISPALAAEFLEWRKKAAGRIAFATLLCIAAVIPLIILSAASSVGHISENSAAGAGLVVLFILVADAVAIFTSCGFKNAPFEFIDKEPFETESGVDVMAAEKQKEFRPAYVKINIAAACLCVLSPIPLLIGAFSKNEFFLVVMLAVTMLLAGLGAALFIFGGVRWASMQKLLKEGDYIPRDRKKNRVKETVSSVYWLTATAVYLTWSFLTKAWDATWVVWPAAGILFAAVMSICNLFTDKEKK